MEYPKRDLRLRSSRRATRRIRRQIARSHPSWTKAQVDQEVARLRRRMPRVGPLGTSTSIRTKRQLRVVNVNTSREMFKLHRREPLFTIECMAGRNTKGFIPFNIMGWPKWLQKLTQLYEKIRFVKISFIAISRFSTMTSGGYVMSFNSSSGDTPDASTMTAADLRQQRNSVSSSIYSNSIMHIPRATFNLPMKKPLCSLNETDQFKIDDTWLFDFIYFVENPSVAGNIQIDVDYEVELFTPQIRDPISNDKTCLFVKSPTTTEVSSSTEMEPYVSVDAAQRLNITQPTGTRLNISEIIQNLGSTAMNILYREENGAQIPVIELDTAGTVDFSTLSRIPDVDVEYARATSANSYNGTTGLSMVDPIIQSPMSLSTALNVYDYDGTRLGTGGSLNFNTLLSIVNRTGETIRWIFGNTPGLLNVMMSLSKYL